MKSCIVRRLTRKSAATSLIVSNLISVTVLAFYQTTGIPAIHNRWFPVHIDLLAQN